jgi:hypothetical protein
MLNRRIFMAASALTLTATGAFAQQPQPTTGEASLKDTLIFGLRPRQPSDYDFVEVVAARVDDKTLPLDLVIGTYRWALKKRPYPYPYFERALRIRAREIGVEL